MANTQLKRYRPGKFADPELDIAIKTAYDQIYTVGDQSIAGVQNNQGLASGVTTVTGSQNGIATGLATVTNIVASIDSEGVALNEWVNPRPTPNAPGLIDLYVWKPTAAGDNTPIASTTPRLVRWIAIGSRVSTV